MLKDIYSYFCSEMVIVEVVWVFKEYLFLFWIWYGLGFVVLNCIVLRSECFLDFKFYNYVIFEDFVKYFVLFKFCGVYEIFSNLIVMDVLY